MFKSSEISGINSVSDVSFVGLISDLRDSSDIMSPYTTCYLTKGRRNCVPYITSCGLNPVLAFGSEFKMKVISCNNFGQCVSAIWRSSKMQRRAVLNDWMDLSACPSPCWWYAEERLFWIPRRLHISRILWPSTAPSWSDSSIFGIPCRLNHPFSNAPISELDSFSFMGQASTCFEKRSTMTRT